MSLSLDGTIVNGIAKSGIAFIDESTVKENLIGKKVTNLQNFIFNNGGYYLSSFQGNTTNAWLEFSSSFDQNDDSGTINGEITLEGMHLVSVLFDSGTQASSYSNDSHNGPTYIMWLEVDKLKKAGYLK